MSATQQHGPFKGRAGQDWSAPHRRDFGRSSANDVASPQREQSIDFTDSTHALWAINVEVERLGLGPSLTIEEARVAWARRNTEFIVRKLVQARHDTAAFESACRFLDQVRRVSHLAPDALRGSAVSTQQAPIDQSSGASTPSDNDRSGKMSSERAGEGGSSAKPDGFHVYRQKGALKIESDVTHQGEPTIAVDGARLKSAQGGRRQFDWAMKIRFQFTADELPTLAAVVFNRLGSCEFTAHGGGNDKCLSATHQDNAQPIVIRLWAGADSMVVVPCDTAAIFRFQALILRALHLAYPDLDGSGLMAMIRVHGELMSRHS